MAGLIPLIILWAALGYRAGHRVPITSVTGHGELFLITSVLLFSEVGSLWEARMKRGVRMGTLPDCGRGCAGTVYLERNPDL